jgi:hypothetical protein
VVIVVALKKNPILPQREERGKNIDFFWVAIQHHLPYYLHSKGKEDKHFVWPSRPPYLHKI